MSGGSRHLHYEQCPKCAERGKDSRRDNLSVFSDGGSHCWSCGYHRQPSTSSRWLPKVEELDNKIKRILPDDFTRDIPSRAWEWLLQYGLPYDYWRELVGWSEKYQRLVFRVGEPLKFSLGRHCKVPTPKNGADSPVPRKWHVWGDSHSGVESLGNSGSITLVEDLLSFHKVYQSGNQVVCLFGTRVYPPVLEYLRQQNKPVIVWLDQDQLDTMPRVCARLELLTGVKCEYRSTQKDPKEYSLRDINRIISGSDSSLEQAPW